MEQEYQQILYNNGHHSCAGNYMLGQVLPQIYLQNPEPVHEHLKQLVDIMDRCETNDRIYLLQLMGAVAKKEPKVNLTD